MNRINDVEPLKEDVVTVYVDGMPTRAARGETVLSTLFALGKRAISRNDHDHVYGAYCGMGICCCCALNINGIEKQRACQVVVRDGMTIKTQSNRHQINELDQGIKIQTQSRRNKIEELDHG